MRSIDDPAIFTFDTICCQDDGALSMTVKAKTTTRKLDDDSEMNNETVISSPHQVAETRHTAAEPMHRKPQERQTNYCHL